MRIRDPGYQAFAPFVLLHQTFRRTQLGIGYVFNRVALDSDEGDFGARLVSTYQGPSLVVLGSFWTQHTWHQMATNGATCPLHFTCVPCPTTAGEPATGPNPRQSLDPGVDMPLQSADCAARVGDNSR